MRRSTRSVRHSRSMFDRDWKNRKKEEMRRLRDKDWLTVSEVRTYLSGMNYKISTVQIYSLSEKGRKYFPMYKIKPHTIKGTAKHWSRISLDRWLKDKRR